MGASLGPQLIGLITDGVIANPAAMALAERWSLTPDQLGMKAGLLIASIFPILSIVIFARIHSQRKKKGI